MSQLVIEAGGVALPGDLELPDETRGLVIFAHGSGSSRTSPRNRLVAQRLRASGRIGTLLFDLLTPAEDAIYANRFDIPLLAERLIAATETVRETRGLEDARIGYFGASTGAAAALIASARLRESVAAVVSRGGRPDLADANVLREVAAPALLIVGGNDPAVLDMNRSALAAIGARVKRLEIVPGATHLFEEPGTLGQVSELATSWFERYLVPSET